MPICRECKTSVIDSCIEIDGKKWHVDCFRCYNCKLALAHKKHIVHSGAIFCAKCFRKMYLPRCVHCLKPIKNQATRAMNLFWHPKCFSCTLCLKPIKMTYFVKSKGVAICQTCHVGPDHTDTPNTSDSKTPMAKSMASVSSVSEAGSYKSPTSSRMSSMPMSDFEDIEDILSAKEPKETPKNGSNQKKSTGNPFPDAF